MIGTSLHCFIDISQGIVNEDDVQAIFCGSLFNSPEDALDYLRKMGHLSPLLLPASEAEDLSEIVANLWGKNKVIQYRFAHPQYFLDDKQNWYETLPQFISAQRQQGHEKAIDAVFPGWCY